MGQLIARLDSSDPNFDAAFARLLVSPAESDSALAETVSSIIAAVAVEGDAALLRFTNQFDGRALSDPENFRVCLLYTSPSPRDRQKSRMPSSA